MPHLIYTHIYFEIYIKYIVIHSNVNNSNNIEKLNIYKDKKCHLKFNKKQKFILIIINQIYNLILYKIFVK